MTVREHWRTGRRYGYPLCCIARYCLDTVLGSPPGLFRRGAEKYVPCGVFHKAERWPPRRLCWPHRYGQRHSVVIQLDVGAGSLKVCTRCGRGKLFQRGDLRELNTELDLYTARKLIRSEA